VDPLAWDRFVTDSPLGSYLQLAGWATVKAVNGWTAARIMTAPRAGPAGAQVLVRRPRLLPWGFAYAPRGPVVSSWDAASIEAVTQALRAELPRLVGRVSHLRTDPEVEANGPLDPDGAGRSALREAGWIEAPSIQPSASRVVDLRLDEETLWGELRKKWRQYVNRARSGGISVVEAGPDRLEEFYSIYRETARRAGFHIRTLSAYRDVWNAFAPAGNARLLFARRADGEALATLFLVRCGPRVVEPYGGMTMAGAESRANYLLKWEAIRSSRDQGGTSYDMWGVVTPGIEHFKAGFGGRMITYIGGWDLVLDPVGRTAYGLAQRASVWVARRRLARAGAAVRTAATPDDGSPGAAG
jgi:lipid II:glycine glycyltransferase (peptidoglycan interpeptide bridge formation enzyme)